MCIAHSLAMKRAAATGSVDQGLSVRSLSRPLKNCRGSKTGSTKHSLLKCTKDKDRSLVAYLWCEICRK